MPRFDGTGPNGMGSKTGKGLGYCDTDDENNVTYARGTGRGMGRRMGRGMKRGGCRCITPNYYNGVSEKTLLRHEKEILEERLAYINKCIDDVEVEK